MLERRSRRLKGTKFSVRKLQLLVSFDPCSIGNGSSKNFEMLFVTQNIRYLESHALCGIPTSQIDQGRSSTAVNCGKAC